MFVYTNIVGNNSDLIAIVAEMYLKHGDKVADVTYGKGVFWRKVDTTKYEMHPSDIKTGPEFYDFRNLPYGDATFDVVVLDPPYVHNPGKKFMMSANYRNDTTIGKYHVDIIQLYSEGMAEAWRILKVGGLLWVKCKDEIESSYQCMSNIEIHNEAVRLGFIVQDFFILKQKNDPYIQHKQKHARKKHSYLWVFKKPTPREVKELTRIRKRTPQPKPI